jgi:hypothetical protein
VARSRSRRYSGFMGALAKCIAGGATLFVVACASLAGIDDPIPTPPGETTPDSSSTPGSSGTPSPSGSSGSSGSDTDGSGGDTGPPPTPPCPKKADDSDCANGSECCSDHCNEQKKCRPSCTSEDDDCSIGSDDECCVGFWCRGLTPPRCAPCIKSGEQAERVGLGGGIAVRQSCCSRDVNADGECK